MWDNGGETCGGADPLERGWGVGDGCRGADERAGEAGPAGAAELETGGLTECVFWDPFRLAVPRASGGSSELELSAGLVAPVRDSGALEAFAATEFGLLFGSGFSSSSSPSSWSGAAEFLTVDAEAS